MKKNKLALFSVPYVLWMAVFVVIPILMIVVYAFSSAEGGFTLENFARIGDYMVVFTRSFKLAFIATVICLLLGYPVSCFLAREGPRFQRVAMMLIMLPMWMNFLLRTYAWMTLLENNGLINRFLGLFGIGPLHMINTSGAVVLGMVYNYLPFMILPLYTIMVKIDQSVIEAAQDLGASQFHILSRVLVPLAMPGITTGITMVFVPALTTFVISDLLGGGKLLLIGNVIEQSFKQNSNWHVGSGLSLVLMVFILISMAMIAKYDKNGEGSAF